MAKKVIWEHLDNAEAEILVEAEPDKIHIDFKTNTVRINKPMTIDMDILSQITRAYEDNSRVAAKIMEDPF